MSALVGTNNLVIIPLNNIKLQVAAESQKIYRNTGKKNIVQSEYSVLPNKNYI